MILAIDIGNTNIVIGAFENNKIVFTERMTTTHGSTPLEYAVSIKTALEMQNISAEQITGAIISSVVPSVTDSFAKATEKYCKVKPIIVSYKLNTGLNILIDNPAQLGNDLIVDAVAGINEYPVPQIIIDMGTATTFSVVDRDKNYIGGIITTGMSVSFNALVSRTSQLPKIAFELPEKLVGTNTIDCLKSGVMYSTASAIDGMISRIEEDMGEICTVILTGGLAGLIAPLCKSDIIYDDELLLKGLMIIYNKNKN